MSNLASGVALEVPDGARIVCIAEHDKDCPPEVEAFVTKYGGRNLFGDPRFRVIWGGRRLTWRTKKWTEKDAHGNVVRQFVGTRWFYKYPRFRERWVIEWWKAPTEYGYGDPDIWFKDNTIVHDDVPIYPRQPFPHRGDYEFLDAVLGIDGMSYAAPEIPYVRLSIDKFWALRSLKRTDFDSKKFMEETTREERLTMENYTMIKDATAPSAHQPWVSLAH